MLLSKSNAASSVPCSPITYTCDVDVSCGVRCSDISYMLSTSSWFSSPLSAFADRAELSRTWLHLGSMGITTIALSIVVKMYRYLNHDFKARFEAKGNANTSFASRRRWAG
jgi:hypothetical protein